MSNYRYTLSNYHAIKNADIVINGITVLAGENGCGKSTLSRWLYYLINGSNRFDEFIYDDLLKKIRGILRKPDRVRRDLLYRKDEEKISSYSRVLNSKVMQGDIEGLYIESLNLVDSFWHELEDYMSGIEERNRMRILGYFSIPTKNADSWNTYMSDYCRQLNDEIVDLYNEAMKAMKERPVDLLWEYISDFLAEEERFDIPASIQLYENETPLFLEEDFNVPYALHRAIYIDTPMALAMDMPDLKHWDELSDMMIFAEENEMPVQGKSVLARIKRSMGGQILVDEDVFKDKELHYHRTDGLDIKLEYTATGIKSFAYLQRLLENGYLNEESLLLIDEPEAHLHPQWIVEFARLLVLLHKQVGLKIMVASHNPDMVSAIQSIARKEGVLEDTCFYQAEKDSEGSMQYVYKNLGSEIGDIFKSFNIAISRIQDYGANSLSE